MGFKALFRRWFYLCVAVVCCFESGLFFNGRYLIFRPKPVLNSKPFEVMRTNCISSSELDSTNEALILNPHRFKYLTTPASNICDISDLFLMVYVHSAPHNAKRRQLIRNTWGNVTHYTVAVRVIFVFGVPAPSEYNQSEIEAESQAYKDILQENFMDTYRNLSYKAVAALKWVNKNCRQAKFVLKSDDDIMVNMFRWIDLLRTQHANPRKVKGLLLCSVWIRMPVLRSGKWSIDEAQWPYDVYPPYCSGSAYTMTMDAVDMLHQVSYYTRFMWVDDAYITGALPFQLGGGNIEHVEYNHHYYFGVEEVLSDDNNWQKYTFSHVHNVAVFTHVWNQILSNATASGTRKSH